jgi:hypothetical protein
MSEGASLFSQGLSYSPWGAVGGLAGSALGVEGSGNMWIDTAMTTGGSILGSMAGISIATAMASGAGGAAAGASAGSVAGPIGAAIGAVIGLALGGVFGGKPSNKEGRATYDLSTMEVEIGGQTGKKFSQENRDSAEALSELIATNIIPSLEQLGDTDISGQFIVGVGNRDPMRFSYREPGSERTGKNWDYGYGRDNSQGHSYYDAVSGNTRDPETYIDNVTKFFAGTIAGIPLGVYDALKKADEGYIDTIRRVELGAELFKNAGDQFSLITPDVSAWVPETGVENGPDEVIARLSDNSSRGDTLAGLGGVMFDEVIARLSDNSSRGNILAVLREMLPTEGLDDVTADFAENFLTATAQNLEAAIQDFGGVFGDDLSDELKSIVSTALADLNDSTGLYAQLMGEFITEEIYAAFKQGEENVFQTTSRVVTSFEVLVQVFDKLGLELEEVGMEGFALTEKMIELAGDFETLAGNLESYYQSFYSEEERAANAMSGLVESLEALGYAIPLTREAFRALVTELEAAGNLEGFNTLIENNQSYAAYYAQMEQWTASLFETYRNTIGRDPSAMELYRWLDKLKTGEAVFSDVVKSLTTGLSEATEHLTWQDVKTFQSGAQDIYDAYQYTLEIAQEEHALTLDRIKQEENLLKSLRTLIDNLKLSDISPLTPAERLAEAQRQYASILTAVEGGDFSRAGELDSAAQAYLGEASSYYASSGAYESIFNDVLGSLESLENQYGQETDYEARIEAANNELLNTQIRAAELLDAQFKQLAASVGLEGDILSAIQLLPQDLATGIGEVVQAIAAGQQLNLEGISSEVIAAYQTVLGRNPDEQGAQYWQGQLDSGVSLEEIVKGMINSGEYRSGSGKSYDGLSLTGVSSDVISAYVDLLGRAPDAQGAYYWQSQLDSGTSVQEMLAAFKNSAEYKSNGSHFGGIESVPYDGYKAILHRGEKVVPASRARADADSALVAEVRTLREEVSRLRSDQERHTQKITYASYDAAERSSDKVAASVKSAKPNTTKHKVTLR